MTPAKAIVKVISFYCYRLARVIKLPSDPIQKIHTYSGHSNQSNTEWLIRRILLMS